MANILPLKKVLPTSPDQIQRFSSEAEAAVARMSHLNRAALYIGNETADDTISVLSTDVLILTKPCGLLTVTDLNITPGSGSPVGLVFDEAAYNASAGITTPAFVQLTLADQDALAQLSIKNAPTKDGNVTVNINNIDPAATLTLVSFFYTVIPQLS